MKYIGKNVQYVEDYIYYVWTEIIRLLIFELLPLICYFYTVFDLYFENRKRWLMKYIGKNVQHVEDYIYYIWTEIIRGLIFELLPLIPYFCTVFG